MAGSNCGSCSFRARYDRNPKSFLGRLWRWHIKFCPGWKAYLRSLSDAERVTIKKQYHINK